MFKNLPKNYYHENKICHMNIKKKLNDGYLDFFVLKLPVTSASGWIQIGHPKRVTLQ